MVLDAGYKDNALRRPPVSFLALARELRLRNAGTSKDLLNPSQVEHLAEVARSLSQSDRERALAYGQEALKAIGGIQLDAAEDEHEEENLAPTSQAQITSSWTLPSLDLLSAPGKSAQISESYMRALEQRLQEALNNYPKLRVEVRPEYSRIGTRVLRLGILPTGEPDIDPKTNAPRRDTGGHIVYKTRTTIAQIGRLENDIQAILEAKTIRLEKPVPGTSYVGVEIPNPNPTMVYLREILESDEYKEAAAKSKLAMALGKDVAGLVRIGDLARMPHVLIAGATGSGKSVMLNSIITCLLTQATPDDVRMWMIDPKMVELTPYNGIPHLLAPVVTEADKALPVLKSAVAEMERRNRLFSQLGVRNIAGYRKLRLERLAQGDTSLNNLPYIVLIVDELADLMMVASEDEEENTVEKLICRLAQLARATGIHLVIATQRPSVDVITGLIKANIPTRISFMVSSQVDSRTILDLGGAEKLLGGGDMLYLGPATSKPERIQGAFLSDEETDRLTTYWRRARPSTRGGQPASDALPVEDDEEEIEDDEDEIDQERPAGENTDDEDEQLVAAIIDKLKAQRLEWLSKSWVQRVLGVGYQKADRISSKLIERGVVAATAEGKRGERRVLMRDNRAEGEVDDGNVAQSGVV